MQKLQGKQAAKMKDEADKNQKEGDAFLAKNKDKPGVKVTASGLQYEVVKQGTGPKPKATDVVKVDYTGTKIDGTKFDSSGRSRPAGDVPAEPGRAGLDRRPAADAGRFGIQVLHSGQARRTASAVRRQIGANATLIFSVKLIGIEPPAAEASQATPSRRRRSCRRPRSTGSGQAPSAKHGRRGFRASSVIDQAFQ